jgi:hypothetical protein
MRKTVKQLSEELEEFKGEGRVARVASGSCFNHAQMGAIIEKYARYGELIKAEITVDHSVGGSNQYHYIILHYPLLNKGSRKDDEWVIAGMSGADFTPTRKDK